MAIRGLILSMVLASSAVSAQNKLALYDFFWNVGRAALANPKVIDSVNVAAAAPSFHPTEPLLLYVRKTAGQWQVVSFNYNLGNERIEYASETNLAAPQWTPDRKYISFLLGPEMKLVKLSDIKRELQPILAQTMENYLWIDENSLFTILPGDPNTLNLVTLRPPRTVSVAKHVGRILQKSGNNFAYVHKLSVDSWSIKRISSHGSIQILAETLPESDLFSLTPDGKLIMLNEEKIFGYVQASGWKQIEMEGSNTLMEIINFGLSPAGDKLFVLFATP